MANTDKKVRARLARKKRVRNKVLGTPERPRFNVFRSAKHIYVQLIDDTQDCTLLSTSTRSPEFKGANTGNVEAAKKVGEIISKAALAKGIETVVFDRNGFQYHGRVKALAEAAREGGLKF